jgi:hypothetical protein
MADKGRDTDGRCACLTAAQPECWYPACGAEKPWFISSRKPTEKMIAHAENLARARGWKDVRP